MKSSILILPFLAACALAQTLNSLLKCQCPEVKCDASNAAKLCQCRNDRETLCKKACPAYIPTYLPCPIVPPVTTRKPTATALPPVPVPTSSTAPRDGDCECEDRVCIMIWPQSCYCANANKQACYEKCGGVKPDLAQCPPLDPPSIQTLPSPSKPTSTSKPILKRSTTTRKPLPLTPTALPTHSPCGGGRPNYLACEDGFICIKDPYKPGCGPECDGLGICVEDKICGGFAGFPCAAKEQVCWDDPRDECAAEEGGNDCAGVCVWPH